MLIITCWTQKYLMLQLKKNPKSPPAWVASFKISKRNTSSLEPLHLHLSLNDQRKIFQLNLLYILHKNKWIKLIGQFNCPQKQGGSKWQISRFFKGNCLALCTSIWWRSCSLHWNSNLSSVTWIQGNNAPIYRTDHKNTLLPNHPLRRWIWMK